jgi:hypothetical protein
MPPNRHEHRRRPVPAALSSEAAVPATVLWAKAIEGTNLFAFRLSDGTAIHTFAVEKSNAQMLVDGFAEALPQDRTCD